MESNHPYSCLALPDGAPFELKPSPGRYWGAFATRPIKKGELVLGESPLFVIDKWHADIVEADIVDAFHRLTCNAKATFLTVCVLDSVYHEDLKEAFLYNCFHAFGREQTTEFYVMRSRFNHSCRPNCSTPQGPLIFANRDIEAGEELVFSYGLNFMHKTAFERGRDMKVMGFSCDCSACAPGTDSQLLSDMRRRLARGLCVFVQGKDDFSIRDQEATSRRVIPDPQRRWAAEHHAIPTTSRMVFALLFLVLAEREGALTVNHVVDIGRAITTLMLWFKTESNIRISRLAMKQPTWLGKLRVACEMYGRPDAADPKISRRFCFRAEAL